MVTFQVSFTLNPLVETMDQGQGAEEDQEQDDLVKAGTMKKDELYCTFLATLIAGTCPVPSISLLSSHP